MRERRDVLRCVWLFIDRTTPIFIFSRIAEGIAHHNLVNGNGVVTTGTIPQAVSFVAENITTTQLSFL